MLIICMFVPDNRYEELIFIALLTVFDSDNITELNKLFYL